MMQELGWREWVALPDLGIDRIKAKVDTGARSSCLHAFRIEQTSRQGQPWVDIWVHPEQFSERVHQCSAPLVDQRNVTDSGGHSEQRFVIATTLQIGTTRHQVEMTLTNRDTMRFRMLVGRTALRGHYLVNSGASYLSGGPQ